MKTIFAVYGTQPILEVDNDGMGLNRDRQPDSGWGELRRTRMGVTQVKEIDLTQEMKQILLEDLAFAFGDRSDKFMERVLHFELLIIESLESTEDDECDVTESDIY